MKSRLRSATCVVSLLCLGTLAWGYFGQVAVVSVSAVPSGSAAPLVRVKAAGAVDGRVLFITEQIPARSPVLISLRPGVRPLLRFRSFRLPSLRRCVWEFDCHRVTFPAGAMFIVACPIWCVAVPLLIPPGLWLWRRRTRRPEQVGFGVVVQPGSHGPQTLPAIRRPSATA
jgi:uncharacterized iron-regulated membrane protein